MADPAQPCSCSPHSNVCCCGPINDITVIQPSCQNLPDGSVINNPAYVASLAASFWTYKFITDCGKEGRAISGIGIPVCETIKAQNVIVFERIDGCGQFASVPYSLIKKDPNFGDAPVGYQWLKIENNSRFDKGVCVEYMIQLTGNYITDVQSIKVKAATNILVFECKCFLVPKCNPQGVLTVTKTCRSIIANNNVTLNYSVKVSNTGNASLSNVQYLDTVFISSTLGLGTITVSPAALSVNTSTPGQVKISGNLGTINPGSTIAITYTITVSSIPAPRKYIINNTATASATGTQSSASCSTDFDAVKVSSAKCCSISGVNKGAFTFTISSVDMSPGTAVNAVDHLSIPAGVTVQFNDFGGCTAVFTSGGGTVPINANISGPVDITISCSSLSVPAGGSAAKAIIFTVISTSFFGTASIENSLDTITPATPNSQIFLGAGQLPVKAVLNVKFAASCRQPCQ